MYKFAKSVFINRAQQDVFDFLSNPANIKKWQPAVEFAEWTSTGMPGVGSTYMAVVKMLGRKSENLFEITHWDPPNRYSYKSVKLPFPGHIETAMTLAPKENGTQLTYAAQIGTNGLFKILEGMLGKQAEKQEGSNIDAVKQLLEGG